MKSHDQSQNQSNHEKTRPKDKCRLGRIRSAIIPKQIGNISLYPISIKVYWDFKMNAGPLWNALELRKMEFVKDFFMKKP